MDLNTIGLLCLGTAFGACAALAIKLAYDDWREQKSAKRNQDLIRRLDQANTEYFHRPRLRAGSTLPNLTEKL